MKQLLLVTSAAMMLSTAAMAQTATVVTDGTVYGVTWSDGVRSAIYDNFDMRMMRTTDQARPVWLALPEEDRNLVLADCEMMRVATDGGMAADEAASGTAESDMAAGDTTVADTGIEGIANEVGLNNTDMMNVCTLVATF